MLSMQKSLQGYSKGKGQTKGFEEKGKGRDVRNNSPPDTMSYKCVYSLAQQL